MNIEAGLVQAAVRRTVVPVIQAMYAVGMLGGALLGALAAQLGLSLGAHLFGLAALELIACGISVGFYLTKEEVAALAPVQDSGEGEKAASSRGKGLTRVAWREKQTVLIALMVMSAGLMEGAANDWLNLSMVDGYGYSTAAASAAFAFFLLMMTIVRFASPRLEARLARPCCCASPSRARLWASFSWLSRHTTASRSRASPCGASARPSASRWASPRCLSTPS